MRKENIASLDCLIEDKDSPEAKTTVVLFHGYGASAHDLYPLHEILNTASIKEWIFPQGFLRVPIGPHFSAHAWFPVDEAALEEAIARGGHRDFASIRPDGFEQAITEAEAFLDKLEVKDENLILGGFSQGAMVATEVALRKKQNIQGLLILSGALLDETHWRQLISQHSGLNFFQSHGLNDPLLSAAEAKRLHGILEENGLLGSFFSFPGGHEIPPPAIEKIREFIKKIAP